MDSAVDHLDPTRHAQDLRETWQCRVLTYTRSTPVGAVVLSVLAHTYDDAMPVLLALAGWTVKPPFLSTAGKIDALGRVYADVVQLTLDRWGQREIKKEILFKSLGEMEAVFRSLADRMRLSDAERVEMFKVVQRWIVCDFRIDPTMDPRDPDAKRSVH